MKLDMNNIPTLVGEEGKARFLECMRLLDTTRWPLYLIGPSGSGKTITGLNLAKAYARRKNVDAYYAQLSPDQTKTSLILGLRLVNGTLKPVRGMVAEAMESGGIVFIDEATHGTQELLLMFNGILDRTSITGIGDMTIRAVDSFRVIFSSNMASYAGNIRLPQSFAQRLSSFVFDYPSFDDEYKIARKIAQDEYSGNYDVPEGVSRYLTNYVREVRSDQYPLSARNIAIALIRLAVTQKGNTKDVDPYFVSGTNVESTRRIIAKRILNQEAASVTDLQSPIVQDFLTYISSVGIEKFKEIVLSSCMYYLDVDGTELNRDVIRQKIESAVI